MTLRIIDSFYQVGGEHSPLSNFYPSPFQALATTWPTVEHYYQAMKTYDNGDRERIRVLPTPGAAKKFGRRVELRSDWEAIKYDVMLYAVKAKFAPDTDLAAYLLATEDALLIEGNTWGDRTWGRVNGVGSNWLGTILMAWRCELRYIKTMTSDV